MKESVLQNFPRAVFDAFSDFLPGSADILADFLAGFANLLSRLRYVLAELAKGVLFGVRIERVACCDN